MAHDIQLVTHYVIEYLKQVLGAGYQFEATSRICGDFGLCDEDLWDLIDHVLNRCALPKPSGATPAYIGIHQAKLTVSDLAQWIVTYAAGVDRQQLG